MAKLSSFGKAFKEARAKGLKTFTWNGKSYTTEMKGEKKSNGPTRPQRRPAAVTGAAAGARPEGKATGLPAKRQPPSAARPEGKASGLPAARPGGARPEAPAKPLPARKPTRTEVAAVEAAERRRKTREAAGVVDGKPRTQTPAAPAAQSRGTLSIIKEFFEGGGLAGRKRRRQEAEAAARNSRR